MRRILTIKFDHTFLWYTCKFQVEAFYIAGVTKLDQNDFIRKKGSAHEEF